MTPSTVLATLPALALALAAPAPVAWAEASRDLPVVHVAEEEEEHDEDRFLEILYPPEFVLEHAYAIGLTEPEREALIDKIVDTRAAVERTELEASGQERRLFEMLEADIVDPDAVMPVADTLLSVETETKKHYLRLLIEIRNQLTPDQRERLDRIREED